MGGQQSSGGGAVPTNSRLVGGWSCSDDDDDGASAGGGSVVGGGVVKRGAGWGGWGEMRGSSWDEVVVEGRRRGGLAGPWGRTLLPLDVDAATAWGCSSRAGWPAALLSSSLLLSRSMSSSWCCSSARPPLRPPHSARHASSSASVRLASDRLPSTTMRALVVVVLLLLVGSSSSSSCDDDSGGCGCPSCCPAAWLLVGLCFGFAGGTGFPSLKGSGAATVEEEAAEGAALQLLKRTSILRSGRFNPSSAAAAALIGRCLWIAAPGCDEAKRHTKTGDSSQLVF